MPPTYNQIAGDFDLWQEYADRVALQFEAFAPEPPHVPSVADVLYNTDIGSCRHRWRTQGGAITVMRDVLRPALEAAYDPSMPDWPSLVELADA